MLFNSVYTNLQFCLEQFGPFFAEYGKGMLSTEAVKRAVISEIQACGMQLARAYGINAGFEYRSFGNTMFPYDILVYDEDSLRKDLGPDEASPDSAVLEKHMILGIAVLAETEHKLIQFFNQKMYFGRDDLPDAKYAMFLVHSAISTSDPGRRDDFIIEFPFAVSQSCRRFDVHPKAFHMNEPEGWDMVTEVFEWAFADYLVSKEVDSDGEEAVSGEPLPF